MGANVFQQTPLSDDVAHVRNVVESNRLRSKNSRGHARQSRVFRAADRYATFDGVAASNPEFFHWERLKENPTNRECRRALNVKTRGAQSRRLFERRHRPGSSCPGLQCES